MKKLCRYLLSWFVLILCIAQQEQLQSSSQSNERSFDYTPLIVGAISGLGALAYNYYWHDENQKLQSTPVGGDFDRVLTKEERFAFLDKQLVPRSTDVNVQIIVRFSGKWTHGKLQKYVEIARSLALHNKNTLIDMHTVELAHRYLEEGRPDKENWIRYLGNSVLHYFGGYESLKDLAIHEAGHVVVGIYNNTLSNIYYVTLDKNVRAGYDGMTKTMWQDSKSIVDLYNKSILENRMMMGLAGGIAVQILSLNKIYSKEMFVDKAAILKFYSQVGMGIDLTNIRKDIAYCFKGLSAEEQQNKFEELIVQLYPKTYQFVLVYKEQIQKVADLLMAKRNVSGDEIYALLGVQRPAYDFEQADMIEIV